VIRIGSVMAEKGPKDLNSRVFDPS
jgi:hypothetical protein